MKETIAVIYGGKSVEHDISIITGMQVLASLSEKYNVIPIYLNSLGQACTADNLDDAQVYLDFERNVQHKKSVAFMTGRPYILLEGKFKKRVKIDCAVLCTHGKHGEDGTLQGLLELCNIPYTSPSVFSSALCMDKTCTKIFMLANDIPTPEYMCIYADDFLKNQETVVNEVGEKLIYPVIVKPASLGSSVGINVCKNNFEIIFAINNAFLFDKKVIVEKFIPHAEEYCCACVKVGGEVIASEVVKVAKSEFFTFEEKYLTEKSVNNEELSQDLINEIKKLAVKTYQALECDGVVRVDFLYNDSLYVNEVNTIPGSLAFNLFNFPFRDLLDILISEAISRQKDSDRHVYKFSSDAFKQFIENSSKNKYTK